MDWKKHSYRAGTHTDVCDDLPLDPAALEKFIAYARARIEPWLSAIFQAEHLNLLLGSGFTSAIASQAGSAATGMGRVQLGTAI
jgi:hypothetical protein